MPGRRPIGHLRVVKATGVFGGVRQASLTQPPRADAEPGRGRRVIRLSLDSWESPIDFEVTDAGREGRGPVVSSGTAPPAVASADTMAIRIEQDAADSEEGGGEMRVEVTLSPAGGGPASVLELRAR
jgi:hypothetical protein